MVEDLDVFYPVILHETSKLNQLENGDVAFCTQDNKIYFKLNNTTKSYSLNENEVKNLIREAALDPNSLSIKWDDKNASTQDDTLFKPVAAATKSIAQGISSGELAFCAEDKKIYFKIGDAAVQTYGGITQEELTKYIESAIKWDDKNEETSVEDHVSFKPVVAATKAIAQTINSGELAFCAEDKKIYFKIGDATVAIYGGITKQEFKEYYTEEITTESPVKWDDKNEETPVADHVGFKPVVLESKNAAQNLVNGEVAFCNEDKMIYFKNGENDVATYGGKRLTWTVV